MKSRMGVITSILLVLAACSVVLLAQETPAPIPFRTAIELALKNSPSSGVAAADLQRARASYLQTRDLFLPQMVIGSGLAFSYGFPLSLEGSAPSIFNFNAQEYLLNPAQRQFVKAAREEIGAAESLNMERRNDVILEAAVDYIQLDLLQSSLHVQKEQQEFA